ncbi:uncharacterized protein EI90DRAFT_3127843 [Cantharellus anzutake]|uniref:uncharacterized protein n=1 Tax=Cantharellus anzutake TaxID=1750568 RepID=UPI0019078048|nr:uncharacterized protein EI90DRAFT_3127843 [Cantharellus anzutake]KAF8326688.1 hypothetical protein EI90DRAFT_3127843 [Cantharellus anzutake]
MNVFTVLSSLYTAVTGRLSDPVVSLVSIGLATSSYVFFTQFGALSFGPVAFATERKEVISEVPECIELWGFYTDRASIRISAAAILSCLSFLAAARSLDPSKFDVQQLLHINATVAFSVFPWVITIMLPTYKKLWSFRDRISRKTSDNYILTSGESQDAMDCIDHWKTLNLVRVAIGFTAWFLAFIVLLLV